MLAALFLFARHSGIPHIFYFFQVPIDKDRTVLYS